ncbi:MAG: type IX secretion system sortase PorU, partial [Bacteroidia bacterium]|nr:type IX secretion system sortase PorU [Bacteroidia bacterium]
YIAFKSSGFLEPKKDNMSGVLNQNIKGSIFQNTSGQFEDMDYIIVAPQIFISQAERLAEINRTQYNLNVKVVELEQIYNEFSSGNQDIAGIKNLVRYVYENASTPEKRIKYLCLFGDASFDYKDRIEDNTNFVPSWHAYSSFNLTNSFVSDDFFGMMDPNEGTMSNSDRLDIAVGRILADSPQRASELVDKIDRYYKEASYGSWRNSFAVISDDVDESWEKIIQQTTDYIGDLVSQEKPNVNVIKIHSDAYQQQSSAGGDLYPAVNKAFVNSFEQGALVVNYFGHGGEDRLADERIFGKADVENLNNVCKLSCFVTVTCEFTRFDNPLRETGGELTHWNPNGGTIGLITTTRKIFVSTGIVFNNTLSQYLFSFGSDEFPSMAESLRQTKTDPSIANASQRRLVFFIGDPAMKLAFPKPNIRLTQINDIPIIQATDTLKALSKVKLSGEVTNGGGVTLSDYNGILSATIYDKDIDRQTLGNDNTTENGQPIILDFKTLGSIIFRGQATVSNGQFEFEFVVPRDISIPVGTGKASFYSRTSVPLQDNAGANFDIKIGGLNENAPGDNIGPTIKLYLNDENFVSGGMTNEQPSLLAILEDENGINTASGIGHDIIAILDNDETNPVVLNNYYETDVDNYQRGKVNYPFRDLDPGLHTLALKAWDVYNNSSTAEIQFVVFDKDEKLKIENVLNYPNPFVNYTEFWFNHNSSEPLDVSIQIFTVSGKLIRTLNGQTGSAECCDQGTSSLSRSISWDGRDDFGDKIGKGVYVYKLTIRSNSLNKKVEKFEKLVIL